MPPPPNDEVRELLSLYARAGYGEYNIAAFLRERPELVARLGVIDLDRDDAELALQLAATVGKYKKRLSLDQRGERGARAERAALALASSARHRLERVELDSTLLLGDVLADSTKKYIGFELTGIRVAVTRQLLLRARVALRPFVNVTAHIDERGLHLAWNRGRGGLNLQPQREERGAAVLIIDLREPARRTAEARRPGPALLAEILTNLGFV